MSTVPSPEAEHAERDKPTQPVEVRAQRLDRLDAEGRERPVFLLDFPADPELEKLVATFERGDYRTLRKEAPKLAHTSADPAVRDAALELSRRIRPEPALAYLLALTLALLVFLTLHAYTH